MVLQYYWCCIKKTAKESSHTRSWESPGGMVRNYFILLRQCIQEIISGAFNTPLKIVVLGFCPVWSFCLSPFKMLLRNSDKFKTCRIVVINVIPSEWEMFSFFFLWDPETAKHHKAFMGIILLGLQKKTTNFNWQEQAGFSFDSCCRQQGFRCYILFQCCKHFKIKMFVGISSAVSFKHFFLEWRKLYNAGTFPHLFGKWIILKFFQSRPTLLTSWMFSLSVRW